MYPDDTHGWRRGLHSVAASRRREIEVTLERIAIAAWRGQERPPPPELAGLFPQFTLEGMFGAVAGFGEVGVGSFDQRMLVAMRELASHGIVAGLGAVVGFVGTFSAVGVITEMIAGVRGHKALSKWNFEPQLMTAPA